MPDKLRFHGVHAITMTAPAVTAEEAITVSDGCAIVSFGLDAGGKVALPVLELERPAGSGIGAIAMAVLSRNLYAPNGEDLFGNRIPTERNPQFAVTVGFAHEGGHVTVAFRTPFASHPVAADRPRPLDD